MGRFLERWRRPLLSVLVAVVLTVSLSLTASVRGQVVSLSGVIQWVTAPASATMAWIGDQIGGGVKGISQVWTLRQQNRQLKQQLLLYRSMKLELSQVLAENGQLRSELHLQKQLQGWHLQSAAVIGRNPTTWFNTISIDRGSAAGIRPGMAAIVPEGVVGRVISVTSRTATIMLLLDPKSGVGAMDVRSQSAGVLLGNDPINGLLHFQLFSHHPNILPNDVVVTSGFSKFYPKGLLLGQVVRVQATNYGLTQQAIVRPAVNFNQLANVMIVISHPSGTAVPPVFGQGG